MSEEDLFCQQIVTNCSDALFQEISSQGAIVAAAAQQAAELLSNATSDENERNNGDYADDATWVLTASFVILTMQSGFGLLEMGNSCPGFEVRLHYERYLLIERQMRTLKPFLSILSNDLSLTLFPSI